MMKKRNIVIIIAIILGIIICGGISFWGYKYINSNKMVDQGIEYMEQKDYDKAIVSFDLVADNSKAIQYKDMINKYLDSKKIFDNGQIDEADKKINEISNDYSNYKGFKEDVDNLKNAIKEAINNKKTIDDKLNNIRDLIKQNKYSEAKSVIEELEKDKIDENQKKQLEDLKGRVNSELEKIETEKKAQEQNAKNNENSKYANFTKPMMTASEAEQLINDKLGKERQAKYWLMNKSGADATVLYYFGEHQNSGAHGPHFIVNADNGEIRDEDNNLYSKAIR